MSIISKRFSRAAIIFAQIALLATISVAQEEDIEATFKISASTAIVSVEGRFTKEKSNPARRNWTFLNSVAGIENLGARIKEFNLSDERNLPVSIKKLAEGEYLAQTGAGNFNYRADLKSSKTSAHASWLTAEKGFLMLGDLLPQFGGGDEQPVSAIVKFDLPIDWKIVSSEKKIGENTFEISDVEKAIFLVGKNWREKTIRIGEAELSLAIADEWRFADAEALKMASEIYEEYRKIFGEVSRSKTQIFLSPFSPPAKFGRWEAETRGATVTIVSADLPFAAQSRQLLHEQLRHELFHLWMPNNLNLKGNYDWFYEGFAIYQALRTGVWVNQIRFEDFLDTLAQAYNLDRFREDKISLLDSSKMRWRGAGSPVYARGMLTAFLCDVALLRASRGKRSVSTILREVYRKHRFPNAPAEGNTAILNHLKNYPELDQVVEKYVAGAEKINWETYLESVGIEEREENLAARLRIKTKLSGKQKDLLNELGYNNWRKLSTRRSK